ncbi:uncharacterized protein [Heliangelus exortis]|uniref:uncharacterized protein n=1 Tax=Heliangelus exortis TaxID=472823 RepID=UPI003A91F072
MGAGEKMGENGAMAVQKPPGRLFGALRLPSELLQGLGEGGRKRAARSEHRGIWLLRGRHHFCGKRLRLLAAEPGSGPVLGALPAAGSRRRSGRVEGDGRCWRGAEPRRPAAKAAAKASAPPGPGPGPAGRRPLRRPLWRQRPAGAHAASPGQERLPGTAGPDGGPPLAPTPVRRGPGPAEERSRPAVPPREGRALPAPEIPPPRAPRVLKWWSSPSPSPPSSRSRSLPAAPTPAEGQPPLRPGPGFRGDPAPGPRLTPPLPGRRQRRSRRAGPGRAGSGRAAPTSRPYLRRPHIAGPGPALAPPAPLPRPPALGSRPPSPRRPRGRRCGSSSTRLDEFSKKKWGI